MSPTRIRILVAGSVLLGFALRLNDIGRTGFGTDEGIYAWIASIPLETFPAFMARDSAAPLYFVLLKIWQVFTSGDVGLRLLSVLFGTASVGVTFLIGRSLLGPAAGVASSFFMAVVPYHVWYSQFAKNNALFILVTQWALYALLKALDDPSRRARWAHFSVALVFLLYSHGLSPFYVLGLAAMYFFLTPRPMGVSLKPWILSQAAAGFAYLPWAGVAWSQAFHVLNTFWAPAPGMITPFRSWTKFHLMWEARPVMDLSAFPAIGNLLISLAGGKEAAVRVVSQAWFVPILMAGLLGAWLLIRGGRLRVLLGLCSLFIVPVGAVWLVSQVAASLYVDRALIPSLIPVPLILGASLAALATDAGRAEAGGGPGLTSWPRRITVVIAAATLGVMAWSSFTYMNRREGPQWKEVIAILQERGERGDAVVFDGHAGRILYDRYIGEAADRFDVYGLPSDLYADEIPTMDKSVRSEEDLGPLREAAEGHDVVWLVLSHTDHHDPEGLAYKYLNRHMKRTDRITFVAIVVVRYERT